MKMIQVDILDKLNVKLQANIDDKVNKLKMLIPPKPEQTHVALDPQDNNEPEEKSVDEKKMEEIKSHTEDAAIQKEEFPPVNPPILDKPKPIEDPQSQPPQNEDPIFKASDVKPRPALWDDSDEEEEEKEKVGIPKKILANYS